MMMPSTSLTGRQYAARPVLLLLVSLSMVMGCAAATSHAPRDEAPNRADNRLDAILWLSTSAEDRVLAKRIDAAAQTHLERALADTNWSALSAQKDNYQKLPPAVIMDIDETVIDTGAFQSLANFISEYRTTPAQRTAAAVKHHTWGTKWFMLPNPMYGSWEASLYEFRNDLGSEEVSQRKFDQLRWERL
jgi:predicted secreted acid phosphatase